MAVSKKVADLNELKNFPIAIKCIYGITYFRGDTVSLKAFVA